MHHLVLVSRVPKSEAPSKHPYYMAKCVCGALKMVRLDRFRVGAVQSCGCQYGNPVPGDVVPSSRAGTRTVPMILRKRKPNGQKKPRVAKPKVVVKVVEKKAPVVVPANVSAATLKTIRDCRANGTRWKDVAEMTGLTVEQCVEYSGTL